MSETSRLSLAPAMVVLAVRRICAARSAALKQSHPGREAWPTGLVSGRRLPAMSGPTRHRGEAVTPGWVVKAEALRYDRVHVDPP